MEEKNLLKEITFLSRLIGQHKNNLQLHNIESPYVSQKTVNKIHSGQNVSVFPYRVPVQSLKTGTSIYSKVNPTLPQSSAKQSVGSVEVSVSKTEHKVPVKKSVTHTNVTLLSGDKTRHVKNSEVLPSEVPNKKMTGGSSSVYINPNFFINAKNSQQEIASLRYKSVHINPRLLGAVASNTSTGAYNKEVLHNPYFVLPNHSVTDISQTEALHCGISQKATNVCVSKPQSTVGSLQGSPEKLTNLSVPLRTAAPRKKYIYQSKMKLVKAVLNTPSTDCKPVRKTVTPVNFQNVAKTIKTPHGGTLLAVSRTKLVRLPGKTRRSSSSKFDSTSSSQTITKSRYRLRRSSTAPQFSPLLRTARKVSSKYRSAAMVSMLGASSKYSLDHRVVKTPRKGRPASSQSQYKVDHRSSSCIASRASRVQSHLLISPLRRASTCNRTWTSATASRLVQKVAISHRRLSRIGSNSGSRSYLQNSALVRIGGLLYKSSWTKLILSKTSDKKADLSLKPHTVVKRRNLNAGHIVYVRGNKFVMDQTGKTLKRVSEVSSIANTSSYDKRRSRVSRVDIGGVTYIQKSPSVLVRTNTHTARNVVSNAKQRSIAFLAQKMRKINTPCLFYRRFGRCPRQEKGRCELVHDPKYIDICRKFLQGKCILDGCLLSHNVGPEKMPTCRFFLEGCCVRDFCPYLHVKVNDRAPICRNFLQGYCADGPECMKRHIVLCPEFDKNGSCMKGKYCPYPHSTAPRIQRAICSDPPITSFDNRNKDRPHSPPPAKIKRYYETDSGEQMEDQHSSPVPSTRKRYFETEGSQHAQSDVDSSEDDIDQSTTESPGSAARRRPKIGDLPSFIALESFESD